MFQGKATEPSFTYYLLSRRRAYGKLNINNYDCALVLGSIVLSTLGRVTLANILIKFNILGSVNIKVAILS